MTDALQPELLVGTPRAIRRNGLAGLGARAISIGISLVTIPLALNYLGRERYGLWATILSLLSILQLGDLGISNGLITSISRALATRDYAAIRRYVSSASVVTAAVVAMLGAGFLITLPSIPWSNLFNVESALAQKEVGPAIAIFVVVFLVGMPLAVAGKIHSAYQEAYRVAVATAIGQILGAAALIVGIQLRLGMPLLLGITLAAPLVPLAFNAHRLVNKRHPEARPSLKLADAGTAREVMSSGSLFFVLQLAIVVGFSSDALLIAIILGPDAVTTYAIPARLFALIPLVVGSFTAPLWPAFAELHGKRNTTRVNQTFYRALLWTLASATAGAAILILVAPQVIRLWIGDDAVTPELNLLLSLGIWSVLRSSGTVVAMLLNGLHVIRLQLVLAVLMAVANIGLSIALTRRIGVAGPVWGSVISYSATSVFPYVLLVPRLLRRIEQTHSAV